MEPVFDLNTLPSIREICGLPEFVVDGLIPAGAVTAITSAIGAGKSFFTLSLAGAVSSGSDFLGRKVSPRKVLYLDTQNSGETIRDRVRALHLKEDSNLKILSIAQRWPVYPPDSPQVLEFVAECNPKPLIVVDTLLAPREIRPVMRKLRDLANQGCAVIVLHFDRDDFVGNIDIGLHLSNPNPCSPITRLIMKPFRQRQIVRANLVIRYADGVFTAVEKKASVTDSERKPVTRKPVITSRLSKT